jgi:hypothetical protein
MELLPGPGSYKIQLNSCLWLSPPNALAHIRGLRAITAKIPDNVCDVPRMTVNGSGFGITLV